MAAFAEMFYWTKVENPPLLPAILPRKQTGAADLFCGEPAGM